MNLEKELPESSWRQRLHEIVFEADTNAGKTFDLAIISLILLSVLVVVLDSVKSLREGNEEFLSRIEWFFTIIFLIEYILRIVSVRKPLRYALSFYGLIDLLAVIPSFVSFFVPGIRACCVNPTARLPSLRRCPGPRRAPQRHDDAYPVPDLESSPARQRPRRTPGNNRIDGKARKSSGPVDSRPRSIPCRKTEPGGCDWHYAVRLLRRRRGGLRSCRIRACGAASRAQAAGTGEN